CFLFLPPGSTTVTVWALSCLSTSLISSIPSLFWSLYSSQYAFVTASGISTKASSEDEINISTTICPGIMGKI
ncbi:hypothetical protein K443DRAFT_643427, partial [Laccaria amethystina LaAM-08-1]